MDSHARQIYKCCVCYAPKLVIELIQRVVSGIADGDYGWVREGDIEHAREVGGGGSWELDGAVVE